MKIEDMSLADLKAALDFIQSDLQDMEQKAAEKKIKPDEIHAYNEVKRTEDKVYHELLNRTRSL